MKKYYLLNGTQQIGPFSIEDLKNRDMDPMTHVWIEGMNQWTRAYRIEELQSLFPGFVPPPSEKKKKKKGILAAIMREMFGSR